MKLLYLKRNLFKNVLMLKWPRFKLILICSCPAWWIVIISEMTSFFETFVGLIKLRSECKL